jgi:hypothetical protein
MQISDIWKPVVDLADSLQAAVNRGMRGWPVFSQRDGMRRLDLRSFERRVYSQNGEDGLLEEIFRRIGTTDRYFVEIGSGDGRECNCARLVLEEAWCGAFVEADPTTYVRLSERYRGRENILCLHERVTSANVESLLAAHGVPRSFDLLSIDIDGNDYWVWKAIREWRARVVVIEFNASHPPPRRWVMKEDPEHRWDGTDYFGASLASLTALGRKKGYVLVTTERQGVNAFFVADELADEFVDPAVYFHYSPPRYGSHRGGHPPGTGPFLEM